MRRSLRPPPLRALPHDLSRTAFETKSMSIFWDLYFPASEHVLPKARKIGINFCNWTVAVRRLNLDDSALRSALLALSLAQIGESHNDRPVSEQAIKFYGMALKEMHLALQDPKRLQSDELLAAGKLMAGYETAALTGATIPTASSSYWKSEGVAKVPRRTREYCT
ncbi:MAG: hypothetical protein Q9219_004523 [cf. Caloplaca sp. 3 TL-2023]